MAIKALVAESICAQRLSHTPARSRTSATVVSALGHLARGLLEIMLADGSLAGSFPLSSDAKAPDCDSGWVCLCCRATFKSFNLCNGAKCFSGGISGVRHASALTNLN